MGTTHKSSAFTAHKIALENNKQKSKRLTVLEIHESGMMMIKMG